MINSNMTLICGLGTRLTHCHQAFMTFMQLRTLAAVGIILLCTPHVKLLFFPPSSGGILIMLMLSSWFLFCLILTSHFLPTVHNFYQTSSHFFIDIIQTLPVRKMLFISILPIKLGIFPQVKEVVYMAMLLNKIYTYKKEKFQHKYIFCVRMYTC